MSKDVSRDDGSERFTANLLFNLIQALGVIVGILLPLALATTFRARLVTVLIVCAAVLLCGALYMVVARRAGWRSIRVAGQVLLSVAMIIVAACWPNPPAPAAKSAGSPGPGSPVGHTAPAHTPAAPSDTPAPASPVPASPAAATPAIQKTGYVLRPSSFFDTNTQDKVDLDTGCPGWGDMHPHVGPSRCGGLADLVVEDDSLHTADSRPDIVALPPGATANESSCRSLLSATPNDAVYSIPATSLRNREVLCVRTDIGNTAVVHIRKVVTDGAGQLAAVTIDFKMWTEN